MPTPRKYTSAAQRQAAYRSRTADALAALSAVKGSPGHALIEQACSALQTAHLEMQAYHDERSKSWQESERAEELQDRMDQLDEAIGVVQDLSP